MNDLDTQINTVVSQLPNPKERTRLRYGYGVLLDVVSKSDCVIDADLFFSPNLADLFQTELGCTREVARVRTAEIRRIGALLVEAGAISAPVSLFLKLGYPEDRSICKTHSLWERFRKEVILKNIPAKDISSIWLNEFITRLRSDGKLTSRQRYEKFRNEWSEWKAVHHLTFADLPEWESHRDSYHFPWRDLPQSLRQSLERWLTSSLKSDHSRKPSSIHLYQNLLERYLGFLFREEGDFDSGKTVEDLFTAEKVHRFLCWSKTRNYESKTQSFPATLLWQAGALAKLLADTGRMEEADRLRAWVKVQDIDASRHRPHGPSFAQLSQGAETLLRKTFSLPVCSHRSIAIRNTLLFLDSVITGQGPQDLVHRRKSTAALNWPESLRGLLDYYLQHAHKLLAGHKTTGDILWLAQGGSPLSAASIRFILQKILNETFQAGITPKQIEEAWMAEYLHHSPNDILTPSSHLRRNPFTVHAKKQRLEQKSAVRRIDESLQGGLGK